MRILLVLDDMPDFAVVPVLAVMPALRLFAGVMAKKPNKAAKTKAEFMSLEYVMAASIH